MRSPRIVWTMVLLALTSSVGAWANPADREPAIGASLHPFQLELDPRVAHESVSLSVSGPGNFYSRTTFASGEPMLFSLESESGVLADGVYTWEAVINPKLTATTIRALAEARVAGDDSIVDQLRQGGAIPAERLAESGFFRVFQGAIITESGVEPVIGGDSPNPGTRTRVASGADTRVASADQVILDDLIVDGSICAGLDCVNGESFGFDTLRLKENNLRIKAQDTSNSASFPTNDWQITFNESSNGGADKFSIDDIDGGRIPFTIEAGAPSHSLFVDDGGRIGLGTSTPVVEVHIVDGDTPTLRLEQDGSSGFTPQTWDVAGNETNFFVRDVTNGSRLPLRIRPSAPSNSIFVDTDGDVGFKTSSPTADVHVFSNENTNATSEPQLLVNNTNTTEVQRTLLKLDNIGIADFVMKDSSVDGSEWSFQAEGPSFRINKSGTGGDEIVVRDRNDGTGQATLVVNGSIQATNVAFASSREKKTDLVTVDPQEILSRIQSLRLAEWRFKEDESGARHLGPMAEDFHAAFDLGGPEGSLSVIDLSGATLAGVQALSTTVERLASENDALRRELDDLRSTVAKLLASADN